MFSCIFVAFVPAKINLAAKEVVRLATGWRIIIPRLYSALRAMAGSHRGEISSAHLRIINDFCSFL